MQHLIFKVATLSLSLSITATANTRPYLKIIELKDNKLTTKNLEKLFKHVQVKANETSNDAVNDKLKLAKILLTGVDSRGEFNELLAGVDSRGEFKELLAGVDSREEFEELLAGVDSRKEFKELLAGVDSREEFKPLIYALLSNSLTELTINADDQESFE